MSSSANDLLELEEFWRHHLADARSRFEQDRTQEAKQAYLDALRGFTDLVLRGNHEEARHAVQCPRGTLIRQSKRWLP
jgi:hypothetical protein